MIKVLFICHGNICRSTMMQSVFAHKVKEMGLEDEFYIDSMGTSREEIGNPPHRGTANKLSMEGIPLIPHRAKQISYSDYNDFDYIIAMDEANMKNLNYMFNNDPEGKIFKCLTFTDSNEDIADPWYTGNYDATYEDVVKGCDGFLDYLKSKGKI